MTSKATLKLAQELLDRFYRDAEGRTNRQLDVYFTLEDMGVGRDRADPALEYLASRGLLNTFGPDIAFLTDDGIAVSAEDRDLGAIPRVMKDFQQVPTADPAPSEAVTADPEPPPTLERPAHPQLTFVHADGSELQVPLQWVCTLGRTDDNDIHLDDKRASKHHAEVRFEGEQYVLHDLESANGTLLNGEYVLEPSPLRHEDEIVIGRTLLLFQAPERIEAPRGNPPDPSSAPSAGTPPPNIGYADPSERTDTPIPPTVPVLPGQPAEPVSPAELFAEDAQRTERALEDPELPEAILEEPGIEPPVDDVDELELLEPDAVVPLDGPIPADEPTQESPPKDLPPAAMIEPLGLEPPTFEEVAESPLEGEAGELDDAATIMTSRAAIFGEPEAAAPSAPEISPEAFPEPSLDLSPPVSPPLDADDRVAVDPRADPTADPTADPMGEPGEVEPETDPGLEPALITLLGHLRERLATTSLPERDALLQAVDQIHGNPMIHQLARAMEEDLDNV